MPQDLEQKSGCSYYWGVNYTVNLMITSVTCEELCLNPYFTSGVQIQRNKGKPIVINRALIQLPWLLLIFF